MNKVPRKVWIVGGVVMIVILAVSLVGIVINAMYSVTLDTMVTPVSAAVRLNGREYGAMGEYRIRPGTYEVEIVAEGFETKTGTLTATAGERVEVSVYLLPGEGNEDWYETHEEDALILGEILNNETIEKVSSLKAANPILTKLPVFVDYFSEDFSERVNFVISYVLNGDNTGFKVTVTDYVGNGYRAAMERIAELVNEVDFEVEYIDASGETMSGHAGD